MKTKTPSVKTLPSAPTEEISGLRFLPSKTEDDERFLAVTSWDGSLRVYDFQNEVLVLNRKYATDDMPIISVAPVGSYTVAFGGLDKKLYVKDFDVVQSSSEKDDTAQCIGSHDGPIHFVDVSYEHNVIVTAARDQSIRMWSRSNRNSTDHLVNKINVKEQILCMSVRENLIGVALSDNTLRIWDVRNSSEPMITADRDPKDMKIQCLAISSDLKKIVYGTADGRATVGSIKSNSITWDLKFKPHIDKKAGISHPVNAARFLENSSRFLMGGSDGKLRIWDPDTHKQVVAFATYPNEVAVVDTSSSGKYAAIACCYLDDRELKDDVHIVPPEITVRNISDYY